MNGFLNASTDMVFASPASATKVENGSVSASHTPNPDTATEHGETALPKNGFADYLVEIDNIDAPLPYEIELPLEGANTTNDSQPPTLSSEELLAIKVEEAETKLARIREAIITTPSAHPDINAGNVHIGTSNNLTILPTPVTTNTRDIDAQTTDILAKPKSTITATKPAVEGLTAASISTENIITETSKPDLIANTKPKPFEIDPEIFDELQSARRVGRENNTHIQSNFAGISDAKNLRHPRAHFEIKGNIASTVQAFTSEISPTSVDIRAPEIDTQSALSKPTGKPAVNIPPSVQHAAMQQVTDALIKRTEKTGDIVVRLDPAELGKVNITFTFEKAGSVTAHVVADTVSTTAILRDRADMLLVQLKQSGFDDVNLSFDTQNNDQNEKGFGAQFSHHDKSGRDQNTRPKIFDIAAVETQNMLQKTTMASAKHMFERDTIDLKL